ncbi:ATP-binding protein [Aliifodinibius sp. S!AR15-10]|uniref:ATP-dependent nuclease n=1 Tax=Aliifodinibius sp. S!AR15-10 TaxID=2950437 RepID=UPI002862CFB0|nr:AAA family ATPase [Aliifodinibius sp. S!AR15-10]MDR8389940.1 ATP-binding protein [Aliifodinibius sp. S!AR15-10]
MHLIDTIEIYYFRSIYQQTISNINELNIFSGNNDVGKSNILKALNLFFNNESEWNEPFDFYTDFSKERLEIVRQETIKGKQQIWIAITFNRPDSYSGSLPEKFRVKKTWTRDTEYPSETDNLDTYDRKNELPSTLETSRRFLSKFLNKIHYEYIPAVKDKRYHNNLLLRLQKSLLNISTDSDHDILRVSDNLAEHIEDRILSLKKDFERATQLESKIKPPEELASLFQSFYVSTNSQNISIPLEYRGDGIQARFIPSVLKYIFDNNSNYFIWGFEEPENSLEYSYSTKLANDFIQEYTKRAQIFITSHSPAFISLKSEKNNTYRVVKEDNRSDLLQVFPEKEAHSEREILNNELGIYDIAEIVHENISERLAEFDNLKKNLNEIENKLEESEKPFVLTEGKTDAMILNMAWEKLYEDENPYKIMPADPVMGFDESGAAGAPTLKKMIDSIHPELNKKVIAVFDRDDEGIKQFNDLSNNFNKWDNREDVKMHKNELAFALLLPPIDDRQKYAENNNLTIEFYFSDELLKLTDGQGHGLKFEDPQILFKIGGKRYDSDQLDLSENIDSEEIDSQRKILNGKTTFAENIVPTIEQDGFENFILIFDLIDELLTD